MPVPARVPVLVLVLARVPVLVLVLELELVLELVLALVRVQAPAPDPALPAVASTCLLSPTRPHRKRRRCTAGSATRASAHESDRTTVATRA